jgi:hypothetical protein
MTVIPCSNSAMKGNNGSTEYHNILSHVVFHCWKQAFWTLGFRGCSQNTKSSWNKERHEGRSSDHITLFQLSDVQVSWSQVYRLRIWALRSITRDLSATAESTMDVEFVKLTSEDIWCKQGLQGSRVFNSAVTCAAVGPRFFETILLSIRQSTSFRQCWFFAHCFCSLLSCMRQLRSCRSRHT